MGISYFFPACWPSFFRRIRSRVLSACIFKLIPTKKITVPIQNRMSKIQLSLRVLEKTSRQSCSWLHIEDKILRIRCNDQQRKRLCKAIPTAVWEGQEHDVYWHGRTCSHTHWIYDCTVYVVDIEHGEEKRVRQWHHKQRMFRNQGINDDRHPKVRRLHDHPRHSSINHRTPSFVRWVPSIRGRNVKTS